MTIDAYTVSGTHHSIAANRISYLLDLRGPSLVVDTACSSSHVATHLACRSLLHGEVDRAIVGAVNLMLDPEETLAMARWGMLAPDGRCKTFDAAADGFVRGEGCGVLVLERLRDATRRGRPARAVVLGSAVNQDGRSNGLTAPNGRAQRDVIREALADASLAPSELRYVEAHGTGTALGDPIELEALAGVLGEGGPHPGCLVGSVKSNLGHLEAAAGLAGLIKCVLAIEQRALPRTLHFERLNPAVDLDGTPLSVAAEHREWSRDDGPRIAGSSGFGMGGTNAHVILGEPPVAEEARPAGPRTPRAELLKLSAHSPAALAALAEAYRGVLGDAPLREVCAAACRRTDHAHRLTVVGGRARGIGEGLRAWLDDGARSVAVRGDPGGFAGIAFVFSGQGSQWHGMGRGLLASEPSFRREMERCEEALAPVAGWSPIDVLEADTAPGAIEVVQPLLFAVQVSLAAVWRRWGVRPDAVVGHSLGEVAAAHVAGVLSLSDAARVVHHRSRLLATRAGTGGMAALGLCEAEARAAVRPLSDRLAIAAVNGPASTVVCGEADALRELTARLEAQDVPCRAVAVDVPAHHPTLEALGPPLEAALAGLAPGPGEVPLYSSVTGALRRGEDLDAAYWGRNLWCPVRFSDAAWCLLDDGHTRVVEISPHPVLLQALAEGLDERDEPALLVPSGRRDADERDELLASLGRLYEHGVAVGWAGLYPEPPGRVGLPRTPLQRTRHRLPRAAPPAGPDRREADDGGNPLLGRADERTHEPGVSAFLLSLDPAALPFVDDHHVEGERLLPGTGSVEIVLSAARDRSRDVALRDLAFHRPILLPPGERMALQLRFEGTGLSLRGRDEHAEGWTERVSGRLERLGAVDREPADLEAIRRRCPTRLTGEEFYGRLNAGRDSWGPAFQGVREVWRGDGEVLARIEVPPSLHADLGRFVFHPAVLDACGQALTEVAAERTGPLLLASLERVQVHSAPPRVLWAHIVGRDTGSQGHLKGDVFVVDEAGRPLAEMIGLCVRFLHETADGLPARVEDWLYRVAWVRDDGQDPAAPQGRASRGWHVVPDRGGLARVLAERMRADGLDVRVGEGRAEGRDVVMLSPLDAAPPAGASPGEVFEAAHRLSWAAVERIRDQVSGGGRLTLVTRGAAGPTGSLCPVQACLWGLGGAFEAEHDGHFGGLVDLDPGQSGDEAARTLYGTLRSGSAERRVALRGGRRHLARLRRLSAPPGGRSLVSRLRVDASYLVTGGLGGLGLRVARRLAARGARRLVLLGRRTLPERTRWADLQQPEDAARAAAVRELEAMGVAVHLAAVDVGEGGALAAFAERWTAGGLPPVRGIVHAAGVQHPAALVDIDREVLGSELRAKVAGTEALVRAWGETLDFLVLFSSAASLLGSPLLGGYAAANAFLDAFSSRLRACGTAATAIDWGVWDEVGMAQRYVAESGRGLSEGALGRMPPERALDALEVVLAAEVAGVGVLPMDWEAWSARYPRAARVPYLSELTAAGPASPGPPGTSLLDGLGACSGRDRRARLSRYVRSRLGRVLRLRPDAVDMARPLVALGLDSLMALELRNHLEAEAGLAVPILFLLERRSGDDLVERLAEELGRQDPAGGGEQSEVVRL